MLGWIAHFNCNLRQFEQSIFGHNTCCCKLSEIYLVMQRWREHMETRRGKGNKVNVIWSNSCGICSCLSSLVHSLDVSWTTIMVYLWPWKTSSPHDWCVISQSLMKCSERPTTLASGWLNTSSKNTPEQNTRIKAEIYWPKWLCHSFVKKIQNTIFFVFHSSTSNFDLLAPANRCYLWTLQWWWS